MLKPTNQNPISHPQGEFRKRIQNFTFSLNDQIGRGYSSKVYRGLNQITKQQVAIKVIDLKSLKDDIVKGLLRIQLECIKKLNHPNLLKYIDSFETVNNCYIITELCDGGDLEKSLRKKGKYTQKQVMQFFHKFFDAYLSFWEAGYIHRDLKLANIFVKDNDIRIADFGFVKKVSDPPKNSYNVGTPVYMPPQSLMENIYTEKADIWAMGIILFQLIHNKVPWSAPSQKQLKNKIMTQKPIFDQSLVSQQLQNFILCCLALDPNTRISLQSIKKHPWMIKIRQSNAKIHEPKRIPLLDITNQLKRVESHSQKFYQNNTETHGFILENKRKISVSQRTTMESIPHQNNVAQVKDKTAQLTNQNQNIDSLIAMLNLIRFQYKVYEVCEKAGEFGELMGFMGRMVLMEFQKLQIMVDTNKNTLNLPNWNSFIQTKKWKIFKGVIEQYKQKYRTKISKNTTQIDDYGSQLRKYTEQIYACFLKEEYRCGQLKDMEILSCLIQLIDFYQLMSTQGLYGLTEKSKITEIVDSKNQISEKNIEENHKQLKYKIRQLL